MWFPYFCSEKHDIRAFFSSQSDLLTDARSAKAPQLISSGHALLCRRLGRKVWAATPSAHSIQPSWLHRTPLTVTSRACLCRCAFVLRSHVGRVVFASLQHDEGVSKRLKHLPLALVCALLVQLQPGTSLKTGGSRAHPSAWTSSCVVSLVQGRTSSSQMAAG